MNTTKTLQVPDAASAAMEYLKNDAEDHGELVTLNVGPSHPATHGVLRLKLVIDGEEIVSCDPIVGYLHRGMEKIAENCHYNQYVAYTDRFDYLAPMSNNIAYACAVEKLLGWELPERGQAIRVLCCELSRISSCFLGTGVYAMDTGAMTAFLYAFEEKERVHNLYEQICGARFTSSYTRIGGMTRDLPKGIEKQILDFCDSALRTVDEMEKLLLHNKIFIDRLVGVGVITKQMALDCGMTGNNLRASGVKRDLRKTNPYLGYEKYEFDVPVAEEARLLRPLPSTHGRNPPIRTHHPPSSGHTARRPHLRTGRQRHFAEQERRPAEHRGAHPPVHGEHPVRQRPCRASILCSREPER